MLFSGDYFFRIHGILIIRHHPFGLYSRFLFVSSLMALRTSVNLEDVHFSFLCVVKCK